MSLFSAEIQIVFVVPGKRRQNPQSRVNRAFQACQGFVVLIPVQSGRNECSIADSYTSVPFPKLRRIWEKHESARVCRIAQMKPLRTMSAISPTAEFGNPF